MVRKAILLIGVASVVLCSTGCGAVGVGISNKSLRSIQLVDSLSSKEIKDHYKKSLEIKDIKKVSSVVNDTVEMIDIDVSNNPGIMKEIGRIEGLIASNDYEYDKYLSRNTYEQIKIMLDDRVYNRSEVVKSAMIREVYVVDIEYTGKVKEAGVLKTDARYLGVHGAFREISNGDTKKDKVYIGKIDEYIKCQKDNEFKKVENGLSYKFNHNDITRINDKEDKEPLVKEVEEEIKEENIMEYETTDDLVEDIMEYETTDDLVENIMEYETTDDLVEDITDEIKAVVEEDISSGYDGKIDTKAYNNVFGSSLNETSLMPRLDMVFSPSVNGTDMGGYGILPQGNTALSSFGIQRDRTRSNVVIRYVLKKDLSTGDLSLQDMYVRDQTIDGVDGFNGDGIFPEFIENEIRKVVDRSDRVISNNDITGLASGNVYSDIRNTIYWGHRLKGTRVNQVSEVSRFIDRKNNFYLVEVVTNNYEDVRFDSSGEGLFQDTKLVVIEQKLLEGQFVIVDWLNMSRITLVEPEIKFSDGLEKRFTYLSMSGKVPEDIKVGIKHKLQESYYGANTKDWNVYYANLNWDTELLSKTRRDGIYLNTKSWMERMGSQNDSVYIGAITDWLGGTRDQVELMTMELIMYENSDVAQYMENYYMLSNFDDTWVIDEIKTLELRDVSGDELGKYRGEIEKLTEDLTVDFSADYVED